MNHPDPLRRATVGPEAAHRAVQALARQFVAEPELILAHTEGAPAPADELATVLAAAHEATRLRPDYADLHYYAAHAAAAAQRPDDARRLLARAVELNPKYNAALILTARVCLAQGESDPALACLEQALAGGADYPDVHLLLGDVWRSRGEAGRAREAYRRAMKLNDSLPAARAALAALDERVLPGAGDELPA